MKTCRICLNQQENGAFCEACGSPLDPDNLNVSESQFPDPAMGAGVSSNTANPMTSSLPDPTQPQNAAAGTAAFAPASANTAEDATKQVVFQPVNQQGMPVINKDVMYSAKQSGETVYMKKKGSYRPSNTPMTWPSSNANPNMANPNTANPNVLPFAGAAPLQSMTGTAAPGGQNGATSMAQSEYQSIRTFALVLMIINGIGLVACCGTSIISFILSLSSYLKINNVINGKSSDPQADSKSANVINWIALVLSVLRIMIWITVLINS